MGAVGIYGVSEFVGQFRVAAGVLSVKVQGIDLHSPLPEQIVLDVTTFGRKFTGLKALCILMRTRPPIQTSAQNPRRGLDRGRTINELSASVIPDLER